MLHLDLSLLDAAQMVQSPVIEGYTRSGARFTAVLDGSFSTTGRISCVLDDLLVDDPWDENRSGFDRDIVHTVFALFDPRAIDQFFFQDFRGLGKAIDGEVLELVGTDLVHKYSPAQVDGLSLSMTTKSAQFSRAAEELARSSQERIALRLDFEHPVPLEAARRKIAAMQSLIEAVGKPSFHYLRELTIYSSNRGEPGSSVVDWWSRGLLGDRGTVPSSKVDPLRSGGIGDRRLGPAGLKELGGLPALLRWVALCDEVPHLLSVLDAHARGLAIDARGSILSLAVGWEHLAARSRGTIESAAWREIAQLLTGDEDRLLLHRQMIELCWNTYLQIKHVALRGGATDNRRAVPDDDHDALALAADFMYSTVLATAFTIAEIPIPNALTQRLFAHDDARGWWPLWTTVAEKYRPAP
ncbi:hypothetical protein ACT3SP_15265 [Brachybacterium sp. AOP43-C2-M15]|uniref:hypothetical protein n=1 Tax=Brachybacterium sp. AOP43-C2-M15 TaxID=3457661 RepID=UPI00403405BC